MGGRTAGRLLRRRVRPGGLDAIAPDRAARAGDGLARSVFETSGRYLGQGIAILADIIDPEVVVVGGIYGRCLDLLRTETLAAFEHEMRGGAARRCRIVPAGLGEAVGDYSALAVALATTGMSPPYGVGVEPARPAALPS